MPPWCSRPWLQAKLKLAAGVAVVGTAEVGTVVVGTAEVDTVVGGTAGAGMVVGTAVVGMAGGTTAGVVGLGSGRQSPAPSVD